MFVTNCLIWFYLKLQVEFVAKTKTNIKKKLIVWICCKKKNQYCSEIFWSLSCKKSFSCFLKAFILWCLWLNKFKKQIIWSQRLYCGSNVFQGYFDDAKESRVKQSFKQRFKNQVSSFKIKFQELRIKNNQDQDSRLKIQESREDSIKISTKKFFKTLSSTWSFHKIFYQIVLFPGNRLS